MQEEEKKEVEQLAEETPETDPPADDPKEAEATAEESAGEPETPVAEADPEKEKLIRELTIARAQLAAVQSDIDPKQAADAVILAVYALEQEGKAADEKAISAALKGVMERHPEWKAGAAQKAPDKAGADEQDKKPEAKGSPAGKVIF